MKLPQAQGRDVEEWIGKSPNTPVPMRVQLRVFERQGGKCRITGKRLMPGEWHCDHIRPLRDGGENRESNLQIIAIKPHREKTAQEATERSKVDRIRAKHFGPKRKGSIPSRPFPKRISA